MDGYERIIGIRVIKHLKQRRGTLWKLINSAHSLQNSLQLNPNYPLAQYHLGQAFERKGKVEQAKAAYEQFLQNWKSADADIPEFFEAKKQFATGLAATDSEALNGWSRAGRAVAKQSLTSLRKPEVTVDGHL